MDKQHKNVLVFAEKLLSSLTKKELLQNIKFLYLHVKEYFSEEEALMKKFNYQNYQQHEKEHHGLMQALLAIERKINGDNWNQTQVEDFVDKWKMHIIDADMSANHFMKQHYAY